VLVLQRTETAFETNEVTLATALGAPITPLRSSGGACRGDPVRTARRPRPMSAAPCSVMPRWSRTHGTRARQGADRARALDAPGLRDDLGRAMRRPRERPTSLPSGAALENRFRGSRCCDQRLARAPGRRRRPSVGGCAPVAKDYARAAVPTRHRRRCRRLRPPERIEELWRPCSAIRGQPAHRARSGSPIGSARSSRYSRRSARGASALVAGDAVSPAAYPRSAAPPRSSPPFSDRPGACSAGRGPTTWPRGRRRHTAPCSCISPAPGPNIETPAPRPADYQIARKARRGGIGASGNIAPVGLVVSGVGYHRSYIP